MRKNTWCNQILQHRKALTAVVSLQQNQLTLTNTKAANATLVNMQMKTVPSLLYICLK